MDTSDDPTITLAGKEWTVPRLAPRQNRIIVPALLRLIPHILAARAEAVAAQESNLAYLSRFMDGPTYEELATVAYTALTRANPELKRSDFDDMPIDTLELVASISAIARQAGLLRPNIFKNQE